MIFDSKDIWLESEVRRSRKRLDLEVEIWKSSKHMAQSPQGLMEHEGEMQRRGLQPKL